MRDGGSVEDDRLYGPRRQTFECRSGGHADLERLDSVEEWQIGRVFPRAFRQAGNDHRLDRLLRRPRHPYPPPSSVVVPRVKIEPADAGCRHVGHAELLLRDGVACVDLPRVGLEPGHHAGTVAAQLPDDILDAALGLGGEAVKPPLAVLVAPAAPLDAPLGHVVPLGIGGNAGSRRRDRRARHYRHEKRDQVSHCVDVLRRKKETQLFSPQPKWGRKELRLFLFAPFIRRG